MKKQTVPNPRRRIAGMTFIEILVVLAILGGLLAVTLLKVIPVLSRGKYAAVALATDQLRKATVSYLTKPGSLGVLPLSDGTIPAAQFSGTGTTSANVAASATIDQVFVAEGFFEKNLSITLAGSQTAPAGLGVAWDVTNQRWSASAAPTLNLGSIARAETVLSNPALTPDVALGTNFNLNGDGTTMLPANVIVEYVVIPNCTAQQAFELSNFIDGPGLTAANNATADAKGAVVYAAPVNGYTTAYVYVTQQ